VSPQRKSFIMRVLHVIPSVSEEDGGPSFALRLMARGLTQSGIQVDVATTDVDTQGDRPGVPLEEAAQEDGARVFYCRRQTRFYKVSLPLARWLAQNICQYNLVHIHALFSYASTAAAHQAMKHRVPYVIRPLGVLNRWGMEHRRPWLKQLSFRLVEQRIVENAAAMHYTSEQEWREAEMAGVTTRAAVIPLGIDVTKFRSLPTPERFYHRFPQARGRQVVLFLSRLDAKKGLDLLLPAFAEARRKHPAALLSIVGSGETSFVAGLHAMAEHLEISDHILWAGFLTGEDKLSAMAAASVFALPSHSENFGIALVEALAGGLPCLLSDQIGIASEIETADAGLIAACDKAEVNVGLQWLLADSELRARLAVNARRLAQRRFSLEAMTGSLIELYEQVAARRSVARIC
jgi:glycosyltransferase involved in cell wall biosynthesis